MEAAIYKIKEVDISKLKQVMPLDQWFYKLVQKKVTELTVQDVSRMLRQNVFLDIAIPTAWKLLLENPFSGEMYDGQLVELLTKTFMSCPEEKKSEWYELFAKRLQSQMSLYEWESSEEKQEVERTMQKFKALFA